MLFSVAVNVLLLGVATIVSALPISQSTSSGSLRLEGRDDVEASDMFERDISGPASTVAIYRRVRYQVALHRSQPGTEHEHWSMHIHPQNRLKKAKWHIIHAVSNPSGNGVLETEHKTMGGLLKGGYKPASQHNNGAEHHILGQFNSAKEAKAAARSLTHLRCTNGYPHENCVDWTRQAVNRLHQQGHIDAAHHDMFTNIYNNHEATVRANTDTHENRINAGLQH